MTTDIFFNPIWDVRMTDTSLRDGSHHKRHQFTKDEVGAIVAALDAAGVPVIEVTHGDGLGGSSFNYGFSKTPEQELIKLAADTAKEAKIAFLMPDQASTRYEEHDHPGFVAEMKKLCPTCEVLYQNADGDAARQQQQFNSVISQGAKAIVIDPVDSTAAASLVKQAQAQGVKIIAYDRPIPSAKAALPAMASSAKAAMRVSVKVFAVMSCLRFLWALIFPKALLGSVSCSLL